MNKCSKWIRFDWLTQDAGEGGILAAIDGDVNWQALPEHAHFSGGYEKLALGIGLDVYRIEIDFPPDGTGALVEHDPVELGFAEPTFLAQTLKQGSKYLQADGEEGFVPFYPGHNFFRHAETMKYRGLLNSAKDMRAYYLAAGRSELDRLLGEETSAALLTSLGLDRKHHVRQTVPVEVNGPLWEAFPASLAGPMRKLHAQAKSLEYLTRLTHYLLHEEPIEDSGQSRANAIHDYLANLEGKLPSLAELAGQFGRSARTLNEEFGREYGKPIVSFISEQRLDQAHQAILETDIPLKVLAHRLGYSQVSHFNTAFRRKFGYPPGNLRRSNGRLPEAGRLRQMR
jgi:AraC-like DNA-binding protein